MSPRLGSRTRRASLTKSVAVIRIDFFRGINNATRRPGIIMTRPASTRSICCGRQTSCRRLLDAGRAQACRRRHYDRNGR